MKASVLIVILMVILGVNALLLLTHTTLAADTNPGATIPGSGVSIPGSGVDIPIDVQSYLSNLYIWFLGFVGISALFAFVTGGILYMFSGTSITKVDQAKTWISNGMWGLILAAASFLILNTINPDLVRHGFNLKTIIDKSL